MSAQKINPDRSQVTTKSPQRKPARLCRTPQECFQAGWEDGKNDPPLTPSQRTRIAALLGPSIRRSVAAAEARASEAVEESAA